MAILFAVIAFLLWLALVPLRIVLFISVRHLRYRIKKMLAKLREKQSRLKMLKEQSKQLQQEVKKEAQTREEGKERLKKKRELQRLQVDMLVTIAAIRVRILLLRIMFATLKLTNKTVKWLARTLFAVTSLVGIITGTMMLAAIITVAIIPGVFDHDFGATGPQNRPPGGNTNHTGIAIFDVDWSGDFTDVLKHIEAESGKAARDWAEFNILVLNVQQQVLNEPMEGGGQHYTIPGFLTGIKVIESQTGLPNLGNTPIHEQELFAGTGMFSRPWGQTDNGLMQLDTAWERFNPNFDYKRSLREQRGGMPTYLPDAFYGITLSFSEFTYHPNMNDTRFRRKGEARDAAFKALGITPTPEQEHFIRFVTTASVIYNAIFLENMSSVNINAAQTSDAAYVNALVAIQFAELFGYTVTDSMGTLVTSIYDAMAKPPHGSWIPGTMDRDHLARAIYGGNGQMTNYPAGLDRTTHFGAVTEDGTPIDGGLLFYLLDNMPANVAQQVLNSPGKRQFLSIRQHWRVRYDLVHLLVGLHDAMWIYDIAREFGH